MEMKDNAKIYIVSFNVNINSSEKCDVFEHRVFKRYYIEI